MDDNSLLLLLRSDPERGMRQLMERYYGLVRSVIRARLAEAPCYSDDVEECAADTFLRFYRALSSFDPQRCSLAAYLGVIARRTAANMARARSASPVDGDEVLLSLPDTDSSGDAENEQAAWLLAEVRRLPPPDGDILFRKFYLGQSSAEIAAALGLTVSNVDTRTHRAIRKLKEKVQEMTGGKEP